MHVLPGTTEGVLLLYGSSPTRIPYTRAHTQALPATPESVLLLYGSAPGAGEGSDDSGLFLQVALQNGVLMRTEVRGESVTGCGGGEGV